MRMIILMQAQAVIDLERKYMYTRSLAASLHTYY